MSVTRKCWCNAGGAARCAQGLHWQKPMAHPGPTCTPTTCLPELPVGSSATTDWCRAGALAVAMLAAVSEKVLTHK